jgi:hypothetical protein
MQEVSSGIPLVADAFVKGASLEAGSHKKNVDSTIEGQAQQKIQEESILNDEGQLLMIELLTNATIARTYLTIKNDELQEKSLRRVLQKEVDKIPGTMLEE